jgi:hypothetical protein
MAEPAIPQFQSLAAFLAWEERQEERFEYLPGGFVRAFSGVTVGASTLFTNLMVGLHSRLKHTDWRVYSARLKVVVPSPAACLYPYVSVQRRSADPKAIVVGAPVVVFDVPSTDKETADCDLERFALRSIPTAKVIVEADWRTGQIAVERRHPNGEWLAHGVDSGDGILDLREIGVALPRAEIFEDTSPLADAGDGP